jgi:hypothetical protein
MAARESEKKQLFCGRLTRGPGSDKRYSCGGKGRKIKRKEDY